MLTIVVQEFSETTILRCSGRIVYGGEVNTLRQIAFSQQQKSALLIDMSNVRSIDASGLGALVELWHWVHESGITLKVVSPGPGVGEALQVTGLDLLLDICDEDFSTPAKLVS